MTSSHVLVQALDGISAAEVTELLVHVVGSRARVVSKPDTKVLDLQGLLFVDLENEGRTAQSAIPFRLPLEGCKGYYHNTYNIDTNDFAIGLLDLFKLPRRLLALT